MWWKLLLLFMVNQLLPHAITYQLNGGRFGDNLSTYCKAKWYSYTFNVPLLYKPFDLSNFLVMDQEEIHYQSDANFDHIVRVETVDSVEAVIENSENILFICNFYSKTPSVYESMKKNPEYGQEIKKMLQPIIPIAPLELPTDRITVAVHVRKGGGFDQPLGSLQQYSGHEVTYYDKVIRKPEYADYTWPTKFPPDQFYIDQIKKLYELLGQKPLHIILFTDDPDPAAIAGRYQKALCIKDISFSYRQTGNSYDRNILEDLYHMARCDCLIRSTSLFAQAAQLLGNHRIIMYPKHAKVLEDRIIIDQVGILKNEARTSL